MLGLVFISSRMQAFRMRGSDIHIDNGRPASRIHRRSVAADGKCRHVSRLDWQNVKRLRGNRAWKPSKRRRKSIKSKKLLHFARLWRAKIENKVVLSVASCQVNNGWRWLNNGSHFSDTFNCSLFNNLGGSCWFLLPCRFLHVCNKEADTC